MSENKDRLTYRPEPETRQKIEQWYERDNCRSMNVKSTNGRISLKAPAAREAI